MKSNVIPCDILVCILVSNPALVDHVPWKVRPLMCSVKWSALNVIVPDCPPNDVSFTIFHELSIIAGCNTSSVQNPCFI